MKNGNLSLNRRIPWHLLPAIITLAWPTMLEELLQTAVQYVDTAMVGSLGTEATAAVGATTTINWLLGTTIHAIGIGFLAFISQAFGSGRGELARKAASQAVFVVLVCGGFFSVLCIALAGFVPIWMQVDPQIRDISSEYFMIVYGPMLPRAALLIFGTILRAAGDSKTPMRVGLFVNVINVVLNFLLIYPARELSDFGTSFVIPGMDLGVIGAAVASAVAFSVGGIAITILLYRNPSISPKGYSIRPDKAILRPCMKVAMPNAFQRFGTSLGYVAFASMINSIGEVATAAHTIANTVESAFYIPGYGMQSAAATMAGNAYGAKDRKRIKELNLMINIIEVFLMIISGGLLFIFAPDMMKIFADDASVIALGAIVLRMVALSEPFYGVSIVVEGMMMGMGKTISPFIINMIGMWGIRILGTLICIEFFDLGLVSAWACMIVHNLLLFASFVVLFPKILKEKANF